VDVADGIKEELVAANCLVVNTLLPSADAEDDTGTDDNCEEGAAGEEEDTDGIDNDCGCVDTCVCGCGDSGSSCDGVVIATAAAPVDDDGNDGACVIVDGNRGIGRGAGCAGPGCDDDEEEDDRRGGGDEAASDTGVSPYFEHSDVIMPTRPSASTK
jgi:hypothetical protein